MNAKSLSILFVITLVVIMAAYFLLSQSKTMITTDKQKFFPKLESAVKDVTEINIKTQDETITIIRGDNQWGLKEKHNYPVAVNKVHNLLLGAADLTILEAKTSKPTLYSKIGVEDVSEAGAESTLVTFKVDDEEVASVIVGKDRMAKTDSTRQEIYVRKPDKEQAWLTLGQLPVEKNIADWLDEQIINIDKDRMRRVNITRPEGDSVLVFRDTPEAKDFQLKELPDNAKVKSPYMLRNIANTLSDLKLDDVTVPSEITFDDETSTRAVFTTFDGLEVTITMTEKEEKRYAKFVAAFNPDAVWVEPPKTEDDETEDDETASSEQSPETEDKTAEKPKVDAKQQAEKLNAKWEGWVYELSKYKVDDLDKKINDLIDIEEPEEPLDAEDIEADTVMDDIKGGIMDIENLPIPFATPSTGLNTLIPVPSNF